MYSAKKRTLNEFIIKPNILVKDYFIVDEVSNSFFHDILSTNEIYLREEQYLEYTCDKYETQVELNSWE